MMIASRSMAVALGLMLGTLRLGAQPAGAAAAAPAPVDPPPPSAQFATEKPSSGFWVEHWFVRDAEHGNPPVSGRFRVNDPFAAFQGPYKDRKEVRSNGMMQILADDVDVTTVRAAELYLETWGGHAGTMNKRVTINGRTTYPFPADGTAEHFCAHSYPSLPLRITDVLRGYNVLQFACERGTSFWGHYIVDEACLRFELPAGHELIAQTGRAGFAPTVEVRTAGETIELSLAGAGSDETAIASVEFFGCYDGFDECGGGGGREWHGFTRRRETLGHLGTVKKPPFRVAWDTTMLPAQREVAVRAIVHFRDHSELVYRTPVRTGLEIVARPGVKVALFSLESLPERFWSRANKPGKATIPLPIDPAKIERAELHVTSWTGGAGEVKDYFTLNGKPFPAAEGHEHRTQYGVFPLGRAGLRAGENMIEVLSDTKEHGIEILKPGPALMVRYRE